MDGRPLTAGHERDRLLLEYWARRGEGTPDWAATVTPAYLYVVYYEGGEADRLPTFSEYYDLVADVFELHNLLGDMDPANDPGTAVLSARLTADRVCAGTEGPRACP